MSGPGIEVSEDRPRLFRDRDGRCHAHQADVCEVCPGATLAEKMAPMAAIGELLRTQDNRATSHPLFIVQQKRRIYGVDSSYTETFTWIEDGGDSREIGASLADALETAHLHGCMEPDGYLRVGYLDLWEFVTCCLTESGAEDYIRADGHNLREPRVYAASAYRNEEMIGLREFLMGLGEEQARPCTAEIDRRYLSLAAGQAAAANAEDFDGGED